MMNEDSKVHLPNVLSVFDGMSCGQVALERAGITYGNYYASEIDKYAITIANKNYPNTIQLGSIENWSEWDLPKIDILIGGSPCQGFSNAGLGLNFDDPRSRLFFTYVDILNDLRSKNPELIFLLENVRMKKEWRDIITNLMGVEPVEINSALVSAQNRKRLYWTNIPDVEQPEDRYIYLKDILEGDEVDREKSYCIDANYHKGGNPKRYFGKSSRQLVKLTTGAAIRNQVTKRGVEEQLNIRKDEKSNCVVPSYPHKLNGCIRVGSIYPSGGMSGRVYSADGKSPALNTMSTGGNQQPKVIIRRNGHGFLPTEVKEVEKSDTLREATQHNYHIRKNQGVVFNRKDGVGKTLEKSLTLNASDWRGLNRNQNQTAVWDLISKEDYRRLSVIECERLQTLCDGFTEGVSSTQRYKMIGNGFTISVIAHIFRNIKVAEPLDT